MNADTQEPVQPLSMMHHSRRMPPSDPQKPTLTSTSRRCAPPLRHVYEEHSQLGARPDRFPFSPLPLCRIHSQYGNLRRIFEADVSFGFVQMNVTERYYIRCVDRCRNSRTGWRTSVLAARLRHLFGACDANSNLVNKGYED